MCSPVAPPKGLNGYARKGVLLKVLLVLVLAELPVLAADIQVAALVLLVADTSVLVLVPDMPVLLQLVAVVQRLDQCSQVMHVQASK